jgi:hypothetical protein
MVTHPSSASFENEGLGMSISSPTTSRISKELGQLFGDRRPTKWVTRERPKIDRIACPWLILRFIDPKAELLYVPPKEVFAMAERERAVAYDIPGAPLEHDKDTCTFDSFVARFGLDAPGLDKLATIVRAADTGRLDLAPEAAGLYAISLGLSRMFADDHDMLRHGLVVYDALYAWILKAQDETHAWPPKV